jgi:hypothetical protein
VKVLVGRVPLRAHEEAFAAACPVRVRFSDRPDAPERAWIVVKALASLKCFHEARDAAAELASKYPGSHSISAELFTASRQLLSQTSNLSATLQANAPQHLPEIEFFMNF